MFADGIERLRRHQADHIIRLCPQALDGVGRGDRNGQDETGRPGAGQAFQGCPRGAAGGDAIIHHDGDAARHIKRPPAYSAVKIGGRRAYALARAGEAVEVPEREVEVTRFELLWREDDRAAFAIECSSGTYVRSLIADLGDAYCLELRRTAIGPFEAGEERLVPLDDALSFLPAVELTGDDARRAAHGVAIEVPAHPRDSFVRLRDERGLIALAEPREDSTLKPVVGFRG